MKYPDFKNSPFLKELRDDQLRKWHKRLKQEEDDDQRPIKALIYLYVAVVSVSVIVYLIKL